MEMSGDVQKYSSTLPTMFPQLMQLSWHESEFSLMDTVTSMLLATLCLSFDR